jgi:glycosyltransferase involved in cell wall biosynthesis
MPDGPSLLLHGNFRDSSSFAIVNSHLSAGLRRKGYAVTEVPFSASAPPIEDLPAPDIYLFNGFPHDIRSAPGKLNVYVFVCEYRRLESRYRALADRVNRYFDLAVVPSSFVARAVKQSGIRVPVRICPHGADPREFHPGVPPERLSTRKNFRFLNVGGAGVRKGFDVLVRAYVSEFSALDDVSLVIKVRAYRWEQDWADRVLQRARLERRDAPDIIYIYENSASVAGYYSACDVGVFPHRGEGFGIPILECLASGRRVIVTRGTGPMDFCTRANATFVPARRAISRGRQWLEPDVAALRRAMRSAYENRVPRGFQAEEVRASVSAWTWDAAVSALDSDFRECLAQPRQPIPRRSPAPVVVYSFAERGLTSWKRCVRNIDRYLNQRYPGYQSVSARDAPAKLIPDLVVGQSEHCLEAFLRAGHANPAVRRIFHHQTALLSRDLLLNAERERCGLEPLAKPPIDYWRNSLECRLADQIVVSSQAAARHFQSEKDLEKKLRIIPWGFDIRDAAPRANRGTLRFLFAGFDPVRKGVRILFEAWNRLRPRGAELWCCINEEVLTSELLLTLLVRNPSIVVHPVGSQRKLFDLQRQTDCFVLPSLEDCFSLTVADGMGMGRPAIVSTETGVADFIDHRRNGCIVPAGSVRGLMNALEYCCEDQRRIREMGEAARETAKRRPWSAFRDEFLALTDSMLEAGRN